MDERSQLQKSVKLLLERFPHIQLLSLKMLVKNEAFRELCDEYEACNNTIEKLEQSDSDQPMLREFKALSLRLEGELLRYLETPSATKARR